MSLQPLAFIDQQAISIRDMGDLVERVGEKIDRNEGFSLFTLNLDHLVKRRKSRAFRELYSRATFVTADGWPVVHLAKSQAPDLKRTTGADLVIPLCRLAALRNVPVALFGSSKTILDDAASRLLALCPGLRIVFLEAPPFGFDPLGPDGRDAMMRLSKSGARLCFVALGAPKQEIFSDAAFAANPAMGFACIGAALDFISGAHKRAPVLVQKLRLEWAWRFAWHPVRLGPRYVKCALLFASLVIHGGSPRSLATPQIQR